MPDCCVWVTIRNATRLSEAIDFDAMDGEPVDVVCLALLPESSHQEQHALACAARVLRDAKNAQSRRATDTSEAYRVLVKQLG